MAFIKFQPLDMNVKTESGEALTLPLVLLNTDHIIGVFAHKNVDVVPNVRTIVIPANGAGMSSSLTMDEWIELLSK